MSSSHSRTRTRSKDDQEDDSSMEDVDSSLVQQRPRRAVAVKDYKDHGTGADADEDDANNNSDSDDSMEDVEMDEQEEEDDDDELEEDDEEDEGPRRSRRRRIQPVRSSLQGPPPRKQRSGPPLRTSSRSTKFTHSMAEPSSTSIRDLFVSGKGRGTPHKSPARRHKQRRRSLADEEPPESSDAESEEEEEEEEEEDEMEEEEEGEPMKVQRIIASRTETLQKWKEIGVNMNTTEVTYGSRWFQDSSEKEDESEEKKEDPNAFEERFLVKWADLSFVHVSWETQTDLVDQVDAKSYLTTFFRKSVGGLLYSQDERCDGDYFDPAYTQVERILEVQMPEGWDNKKKRRNEGDKYDYGMVMDRADPKFDDGAGRQLLIKWGNLPYSEATYEFERDLILNDIEYEEPLNDFGRRNKKPTKADRKAYLKKGVEEQNRLRSFFGNKDNLSEEEHEAAVNEYKQQLQDQTYKNGGQLRDYQAEGVAWMISNFVDERSCILADEMGLGKTLQTAATANLLTTKLNCGGPVLIVAPLSTLTHWYREFTRWTDLNTIIYHGSSDDRKLIREHEFVYESERPTKALAFNAQYLKACLKKKANKLDSPWMVEVVITTPEMMVTDDAVELSSVEWELLVVDEAHRLKNHNSKLAVMLRNDKFSFRHRMLLTGTPIQNDVKEFWTLLNFIDPKGFGDSDEFMERYGDMKSKDRVDELHEEIRPYILRRLKEDVERSVPPKEETLIEVELTVAQKQYYRALYEKNVKFLHKNKKKALDGPSLNNLAMQLRKCCNHLFLLNGVEEEFRAKREAMSEGDFLTKASGKLVLLDKLLPRLKEQGHRVLLFSQFKIMLDILEDYLNARTMKFERIDGSITGNKRQQAIDRFQSPSSAEREAPFIMMLSTRAGGVGINLTAADTVIIFDSDWNPQNDLQAQARCHRIGQTKSVKIYRLLTRKTYEMQMFHMSSLKMGLDQAVLKGFESGASGEATLSKEEVENLLRHGAYDIFNEDKAGEGEAASNDFVAQDIDSIMQRHSRTVVHENTGSKSNAAGGTFSKASFSTKTRGKNEEIDIEDPDFWTKMVGEGGIEDEDERIVSGRRQREQKDYSDRAYNEQLNAQLYLSNEDSDGSSDDSDEDAEEDENQERSRWGGKMPLEWKKDDVENLIKGLSSFGYGRVPWEEFLKHLELSKQYGIEEIKRMCWTLVLTTLIETASEDGERAMNREVRAAEKDREKTAEAAKPADGGVLAVSLSSEKVAVTASVEELKQKAFEKLSKEASDWMEDVIADAVAYAKEKSPREKEFLNRVLHKTSDSAQPLKQSEIASMFATSVWPSLKSRGWKADVISEGDSAGKTRYSYDGKDYFSTNLVLKAALPLYPELQNAIETIMSSADESRRVSQQSLERERVRDLALNLENASPESLKGFLERYGSFQLLVDRSKSTNARIRLPRKILTASTLMNNAVIIVRRSAESAKPDETSVDRLGKTLVVDKKTALPHPLWTARHDSVLIHAIAKHGWIEQDASVRAIAEDSSVKWGRPFDILGNVEASAGRTFDNSGQIMASADRAAEFFNGSSDMIEALKGFHQDRVARSYGLTKQEESGSELLGGHTWVVDRASLPVPGNPSSDSNKSESAEQVELPPKKDLVRRARTILLKSLSSICAEAKPEAEKPSHGYTVLDQRDGANVFLAELLRGILKEPGQSKWPKKLCAAAIDEARRRADALSAELTAGTDGAIAKQVEELRSIAEHIEDAKRHITKSAVQYKNVIRVILGEEPQKPRKETEQQQLFPPKRTLPKVVLRTTTTTSKPAKRSASKHAGLPSGEKSIVNARKRLQEQYGAGGTAGSESYLELTEIETFILSAACSIGIPVWTEEVDSALVDGSSASSAASGSSKLTWPSFGEFVVDLAEKAFEMAKEKFLKAQEEHRRIFDATMESTPEDYQDRGVAQAAYDAAQRNYVEKEDVVRQANDYRCEPSVLAKKCIMLLAKIREHMPSVVTSTLAARSDNSLGSKVMNWLGKELTRWATTLDLLDNYGKPLAFTAVEFLNDLPENERSSIEVSAVFDKKGCRLVAAQVAMMSRLRSVFISYDGDSLSEKIVKAAKTAEAGGDKWDKEPLGWSSASDVVLLNRLVDSGMTDVFLRGTCSFGQESVAAFASSSFRLTKGALQTRANQLTRELHAAEETFQSVRVLEERRNASLPVAAAKSSSSSSTTTTGAATSKAGHPPPPQQPAGGHPFFGSAIPEKEPQHQVIDLAAADSASDTDEVEVLRVEHSPPEKRKSSDSNSSEKKPRTS